MSNTYPRDWMWSEAVDMLARAEKLHRRMFQPHPARTRSACWEPPVDVIETEREVLIFAALPGVDPEQVQAVIDGDALVVAGERTYPAELRTAQIHRLELPQGCFERRIPLPAGHYGAIRRASANGCLVVSLQKVTGARISS